MPRVKAQKRVKEDDDLVGKNMCADWKLLLDEFTAEHHNRMEDLEKKFDEIMKSIDCEEKMVRIVITGINETLEAACQKELDRTQKADSTVSSLDKSRKRSRSCVIEDEGYLTEDSRGRKLKMKRKSRSLSRANLTVTFQASVKKGPPNSAYRNSRSRIRAPLTPFNNTLSISQRHLGAITPKVNPNRPLTLLRRPKQGELAVSMQGSPLMVSSIGNDNTANVNIPFTNGTIMSVLPMKMGNVDPRSLPDIDTPTRNQLIGLVANLTKIVQISSEHAK